MTQTLRASYAIVAILVLAVPASVGAFNRDDYPHWRDLDGGGVDTREDISVRDSRADLIQDANCTVQSGLWICPYTSKVLTDPADIHIKDLVALAEIYAATSVARWKHRISTKSNKYLLTAK